MDPANPDFPTVHRRERESIRQLDGKPLADGQRPWRHDSGKLAVLLMRLIEETLVMRQ